MNNNVMYRKKTILFSHIFAFLGAALSSACVVAGSPELLMIGRILVGVNSGMTEISYVRCVILVDQYSKRSQYLYLSNHKFIRREQHNDISAFQLL